MHRITACPTCGCDEFLPHCDDSHVCDLTQCTRCHAYGTVDARRWTFRPGRQVA